MLPHTERATALLRELKRSKKWLPVYEVSPLGEDQIKHQKSTAFTSNEYMIDTKQQNNE